MTLRAPVFLSAFSRGGSNIVWNLLASHPNMISPRAETHEIFFGKLPPKALQKHVALDLKFGAPFAKPQKVDGHWFRNVGRLSPDTYVPRDLSPAYRGYVNGLYEAINTLPADAGLHGEKQPGEAYTPEEWAQARIVFKSINGTLWLNPVFAQMYPDATFIHLVRDGLALSESRVRRQTFAEAGKFGVLYKLMIDEMQRQAETLPNCHLMRFEDLLEDPVSFIDRLFELVGEDLSLMPSIRLRAKAHYDAAGNYVEADGQHAWLPRENIFDHVNPEITAKQVERLSPKDRDAFLKGASGAMTALDYPTAA